MNEMVKLRDPATVLPELRSGERSLSEEINCLLDRVKRYEPEIQALLPDEDNAQRRQRILQEAQDLEARWPDPSNRPALYGLVIGVKDLFHTRGFPTRAGSRLPARIFQNAVGADIPGSDLAETSAESVRLLQDAGALVLGKTVTTEFAYFGPGPTRNPWNTDHTPGGSSSGSAAAVAAGFAHAAFGTQTIGSISRPASFCGLAGYKPSFDRISTEGVIPFSPNADHVGMIAASARALEVIAPVLTRDWRSSATVLTHPRPDSIRHQIGTVLVPDDAYLDQAGKDACRALEAVQERLESIGINVQRVNAFPRIDRINSAHQEMIARDFAGVHERWFEEYHDLYHERSRELVERGRTVPEDRYTRALEGREELRDHLETLLRRHSASLWIAPATVGDAPPGIDATGSPIMNLPWTYAGVPTVSLPITRLPHGTGEHGLPLGIQLAAPFNADEELIAMAVALENVLR